MELAAEFEEATKVQSKQVVMEHAALARNIITAGKLLMVDGWKYYLKAPGDDKPNSSPGTMENYKRNYREFADWMTEHYPDVTHLSDSITPDMAREYWEHLKEQGLSPNTLNYKRGSLMLIFRVLKKRAGLSGNVWEEIPRARVSKRGANGLDGTQASRKALPFYESVELLKVFDDPNLQLMHKEQMRTLFAIGIMTGLRLIDAVNLKWEYLKAAGNGKIIELYPRKTIQFGKQVHIPVDRRLQVELERAANETPFVIPDVVERYDKNPSGIRKDCLKVFRHAGYETTVDKGNRQRVQNITVVGFHSFRTSLFSYLAGQGLTIEKLSEISGDSAATLSKYYLKSEQTELAENVCELLESDKKLAQAFDDSIEVKAVEVDPERRELHQLTDTADIEHVRKALTLLKALQAS